MRQAIFGVDTSNYTTSVAAVCAHTGDLMSETRALLPVKTGDRGLRQSEALFLHVQRLPLLIDALRQQMNESVQWQGAGVSVRPRPLSSSYMPVFWAGLSFVQSLTRMLDIPMMTTSHQEGHLEAALSSMGIHLEEPFVAIHLSGGTSDVLYARKTRLGYRVEVLGEGADLHAGQFVDRVGVRLGLPFPAGPHLEKLAQTNTCNDSFRIPSRTLGAQLSFSGACSAAERAINAGIPGPQIAYAVQACIANAVVKSLERAFSMRPDASVAVIVGGVAANSSIRERVTKRMGIVLPNVSILFSPPKFASDNAFGVARIAYRFFS